MCQLNPSFMCFIWTSESERMIYGIDWSLAQMSLSLSILGMIWKSVKIHNQVSLMACIPSPNFFKNPNHPCEAHFKKDRNEREIG